MNVDVHRFDRLKTWQHVVAQCITSIYYSVFFPLICHLLGSWQIAAKRWKRKQCSSITYKEKQQKNEKSSDKQILNRNIEAAADFVWASSSSWHTRRHYKGSLTLPRKWLAAPLPSLNDLYITRCLKRARSISRGCTHPGHRLFKLPPSVRGLGALKSGANQGRLLQQAKCLISANTWLLFFKYLYIWFTLFYSLCYLWLLPFFQDWCGRVLLYKVWQ